MIIKGGLMYVIQNYLIALVGLISWLGFFFFFGVQRRKGLVLYRYLYLFGFLLFKFDDFVNAFIGSVSCLGPRGHSHGTYVNCLCINDQDFCNSLKYIVPIDWSPIDNVCLAQWKRYPLPRTPTWSLFLLLKDQQGVFLFLFFFCLCIDPNFGWGYG